MAGLVSGQSGLIRGTALLCIAMALPSIKFTPATYQSLRSPLWRCNPSGMHSKAPQKCPQGQSWACRPWTSLIIATPHPLTHSTRSPPQCKADPKAFRLPIKGNTLCDEHARYQANCMPLHQHMSGSREVAGSQVPGSQVHRSRLTGQESRVLTDYLTTWHDFSVYISVCLARPPSKLSKATRPTASRPDSKALRTLVDGLLNQTCHRPEVC